MKYRSLTFSALLLFAPTLCFGACSVANLTRCLDSVCAINIGANPAARCQYCGTESAGEPSKSIAMRNVSAGTSTKYIVSDKELKKAPTSPGDRYVWATRICMEKVTGCSADDVSDNYDSLIEQSCKAAGITAEMKNLAQKVNKGKANATCATEIESCVVESKRCNADYKNCKSDSDFDKYLSECSTINNGCESFLSDIRNTLNASRKTAIANADKLLKNIVNAYKSDREQRLKTAQANCKNNKAFNDCVKRVCESNMRNKCGDKNEKTAAESLCNFYNTACERLK
jgi:hypothetical protein